LGFCGLRVITSRALCSRMKALCKIGSLPVPPKEI
jgi:hypothetical protein